MNMQPGHWGIWRDNVGMRILVSDHVPAENCWKLDTCTRRGHALWEVAWDQARSKARRAGYKLLCRSDRIGSLNRAEKAP